MKAILRKSLLAALATGLLALAAVVPARADYSNTVMSLNPIGYWRLNDAVTIPKDTATNSGTLGTAANGVYQGTITHRTNGALVASSDTATYFISGGQGVTIPYNAVLNTTVFSAEIWAFPTATNASAAVMSSGQPAAGTRTGWVLYQIGDATGNYWSFRAFTNSGAITVTGDANGIGSATNSPVTTNAWQHVVAVNDGTNCYLYVNGVLAAQTNSTTYVPATTGGTTIGYRYGAANNFFGSLDECVFYTNALTAQEVLDHYTNGLSASPSQPYDQLVQTKAPAGYYRLNEPPFVYVPPVAINLGSWGPTLNGAYQPTTAPMVAGPPYAGFGPNSYATYFNNTFSSYVNIPAQTNVSISTVQSLTVTAWIKRNGTGIYWNMVYSHPNAPGWTSAADSTANPLNTSVPPTGIGFNNTSPYNQLDGFYKGPTANAGQYGWSATPTLAVPDTTWTFVAMVVDGTKNMVLYMNDQARTNAVVYGAHDFSTCDALIGKKQQLYGFGGTETSGFLGSIAEVAIFDQALTRDQLMQLFGAAQVPVTITQQPRSATALTNGLAAFAVQAAGSPPLSYQWYFNPAGTATTNAITDATNSTYYVWGAAPANEGKYFVQVSNPAGSTNSALVSLTLRAPSVYNTAVLGLNPVAYWPLDDSASLAGNLGSWGTNAYGAVMGGATNGAPGAPWRGFGTNHYATYFPGNNGTRTCLGDGLYSATTYAIPCGPVGNPDTPGSCVRIPAQSGIVTNMTITCWVARNGNGSNWRGVVVQRDQDPLNDPDYGMNHQSGKGMGLTFGSGGTAPDAGQELRVLWNRLNCGWQWSSGLNTSNQVWAFCAVVFTPTNRTVWLNTRRSVYNVTQPESWSGVPAPAEWDFGCNPIFLGYEPRGPYWGENNAYIGSLNDVAIFDRALTTNEMLQIYAGALVPPIIVAQPQGPPPPVYEGSPLSLSVVCDVSRSATALGYQWTKNGTPIPGQTTSNFAINPLATTDSGSYAVVITNNGGAVTSSVVALTVLSGPPVFVQKPVSLQRYVGANATFTSWPAGSAPLSYQWNFNNTPIPGATASTYTITQVGAGDVGSYSLLVTNRFGSTNSGNVTLTLIPVTCTYAAEVVASRPKAYWRFNEGGGTTAFDYYGGYNGTNVQLAYTNNAPRPPLDSYFYGFEATNTACTWTNASNSQVNLPAVFAINPAAFSIMAWVRADTILAQAEIMAQGTATWHVRLQNSTSGFPRFTTTGLTGPNNNFVGLSSVVDQFWHQVVAVYDGANKYIYVDGNLNIAAPLRAEGLETLDANLVRIGSSGTTPRWNGDLDEVAVYDRGLSAAEVANLYNVAYSGPGAPQILVQPVSQVVFAGQPVVLSVTAAGGAPYTYQWYHNGTILTGATKSMLTLPSAFYTDSGTYQVAVNNSVGPLTNSDLVTLTVAVPPSLTEFANITNNLVLHLKFDGDYTDSSGRTNNATPVGAPTLVTGKFGQAVHLSTDTISAITNCLAVSDTNSDLSFAEADSFTVAFWLRYTAAFNDLPIIGNAVNSTYSQGWVMTESGGRMLEWTALSGSVNVIRDPAGGPALNDGQWHNMTVAFDRTLGQASSYVDGVLVNSAAITPLGTLVTGNGLTLGQDPTGKYGVNGAFDLDDVGIWRRALSPAEAASIYLVGQTYGQSFDTYGPVMLGLTPPSASNGQSIELIWQAGTLLESTNVTGPYAPVSGATAPYYKVTPGAGNKFYRVQL